MSSALSIASDVFVGVVGAIHVFIFNLESLTWYRGSAKGFGVKPENYQATAVFAANQGFYNLILAAGCFWALYQGDYNAKLFFVTSVLCAGIIGFISTGSAKILRAQCLPTLIQLALTFYGQYAQNKLDTQALGAVGLASLATIFISKFVKARLDGDLAFFLKKNSK